METTVDIRMNGREHSIEAIATTTMKCDVSDDLDNLLENVNALKSETARAREKIDSLKEGNIANEVTDIFNVSDSDIDSAVKEELEKEKAQLDELWEKLQEVQGEYNKALAEHMSKSMKMDFFKQEFEGALNKDVIMVFLFEAFTNLFTEVGCGDVLTVEAYGVPLGFVQGVLTVLYEDQPALFGKRQIKCIARDPQVVSWPASLKALSGVSSEIVWTLGE